MKYTVVIATIREELPGFQETMEKIRATFSYPTDFHILNGHGGKAQALNQAADEILAATDADCYVTMDDDIVPGPEWQPMVEAAFQNLPKYGAFGLWMGDEPDRQILVGAHCLEEEATAGPVRYRRVKPPHHLNGGFIAYRTEVARQVGKIPTEGVRYQLWEDAWRGRRVTKQGWEMAFLKGTEVEMVDYPDPKEYLQRKEEEVQVGKQVSERVLNESGLGDPLSLRLRKWVAKARGRSK
jgi:GT2 family glycosyltransferase